MLVPRHVSIRSSCDQSSDTHGGWDKSRRQPFIDATITVYNNKDECIYYNFVFDRDGENVQLISVESQTET